MYSYGKNSARKDMGHGIRWMGEANDQKRLRFILCTLFLVVWVIFGVRQASLAGTRLEVHFLDVGQGDSILVSCGGHHMMVDFGNNSMGTKVQYYLQKQGISTLDYAIGTHPDADHIGGMDVILYKFDVRTVLLPDMEADTATYRDVVDTCRQKRYSPQHPEPGTEYSLGTAKFTVLSPERKYPDSNDNSIVIRLEYKDTSVLFMGDASKAVENDLMESGAELKSDVIKLGHHGSKYSSSKKFLKNVGAGYAVISCGADNPYGHPHKRVMKILESLGIEQFRTDKQGTVILTSDGKKLGWNMEPSNDFGHGKVMIEADSSHGKGTNPDDNTGSDTGKDKRVTYVLNTNTHKFHLPSCSSVNDMADKNTKAVEWTREECIGNGYASCKRCNP